MDESFDERERAVIKSLLAERFELGQDETKELLETAQGRVEGSLQLYGFTSVVKDNFTPEGAYRADGDAVAGGLRRRQAGRLRGQPECAACPG